MTKIKYKNKYKLFQPWINGELSNSSINKAGLLNPFLIISEWVFRNYFPNLNLDEMKAKFKLWNLWLKTKGPKWTIARIKFMRLTLVRYLSGTPLKRAQYVKYWGKSHLPKGLPFVREILSEDLESIRGAFSLLEWGKTINYWDEPNFDSIITESTPKDISNEILDVMNEIGLGEALRDTEWQEFHYSIKSGPNGPAISTALIDLVLLDKSLKDNIKILGGEKLNEIIVFLTKTFHDLRPSDLMDIRRSPSIRRISIVRDPENKVRPIAIFDYWSQTALKPIHDKLYQILNLFASDKTFSQRRVNQGNENYCFDLSKFTDRFPISLQSKVMEVLFGNKEKSKAWEYIMTHESFTYGDQKLKYATGQPMGAYSSWAVCTLTHHLVVQLAIKRAGYKPCFDNRWYVLLGDDIVIYNKEIALEYEKIINSLNVEISEEKTTKSKDFMEFAKCYFYKGNNVTPFHLNALYRSYKSFDMFCSFLSNMHIDGWDSISLPEREIKLLLVNLGMNRSWASRQASLLKVYNDLNDYVRDPLVNIKKPFDILQKVGFNWSCNSMYTQAPKFLMEVCASLKLQSLQDSFIRGIKEINKAVKAHIGQLNNLGVTIRQEDLDMLPIVSTLIGKHRSVTEEIETFEGAAVSADWLQLFQTKYSFLPDATMAVSLRPRKHRKDQSVKTVVQKLTNFLIQESLDRKTELSSYEK